MSKINNTNNKRQEQQKAISLDSDNSNKNINSIRLVSRIIKSEITQDGEGVILYRSFPNNFILSLIHFCC